MAATCLAIFAVLIDVPAEASPIAGTNAQAVVALEDPFAQAGAGGDRVELVSERTETDTAWANPDGTTTVEMNSDPVRVRDDAGSWVKPNYDLKFDNGKVIPKASDTEVSFSAGTGDMVSIANEATGSEVALAWPGDLPVPELEGPTATYHQVMPGVDLVMTAVPGGYTQVLRVESAEAATNPDLARLTFDADLSSGASVDELANGGLQVTSANGDPVFMASQPTMWDSAGTVNVPGADEAADEGDRIRSMGLEASDDAVVVVPDQHLLDGPSTVYPVYIDPALHTVQGDPNGRTMVQKEYPTTEFYNWDNNDGYGEGVGYQNASGVSTKRLYWKYDISNVPDASTVTRAAFSVNETHSWSCTPASVVLDRTGNISASTNWNNKPDQVNTGNLASSSVQVRLNNSTGGACKTQVTSITFGLDSGDTLNSAVQSSLDDNWIALRLKADEASTLGWKRFQSNATLSVTYNRPPKAFSRGFENIDAAHNACGTYLPATVTNMPGMWSFVDDPDGDSMDVRYDIDRIVGSTTTSQGSYWDYDRADASTSHRDIPLNAVRDANNAFVDGKYQFTAVPRDQYTDPSGTTHYTVGVAGSPCVFYIDSTRPVVSVSATVTEADGITTRPALSDEWLPPGRTLTLTYNPAGSLAYDGKNDVVSYYLESDLPAYNGKTVLAPALGVSGTSSIDTSGVIDGEHWITVQSIDRAGWMSTVKRLDFRVNGALEVARYDLNENGGTTATANQAGNPVFALAGPSLPTWIVQHAAEEGVPADSYLHPNGSGGASATSAVVDDTHAFAVSAWVRATDVTARRVIASQRTASGRAFSLAIQPGCGTGNACATFTVWDPTGAAQTVTSTRAVTANGWFVIAGSFDDLGPLSSNGIDRNHQIRVWVADKTNQGSQAAPVTVSLGTAFTPAAATGTDLGQETVAGAASARWIGDIEDVRFYTDEVGWRDISNHVLTDDPTIP